MMTPRQRQELQQILTQLGDLQTLPAAADKPRSMADAICPECRRAFTWNKMQLNADGFHLLCSGCAAHLQMQALRRRPLRLLKLPGFYVIIMVVTVALLWLAGAGRLGPEAIKQADQKREWPRQRYPRLLIARAAAARKRADYLATHGDPELAVRWAELAESSFRKAADMWHGQPIEPDLLAAAALMRSYQNQTSSAYEELNALLDRYPQDDRVIKTLHFHCGRLALESARQMAGKTHLETALALIRGGKWDPIAAAQELHGMAQAMGEDLTAELVRNMVIQAGGLLIPEQQLLHGCLALLKKYEIPSDIADQIVREAANPWGSLGLEAPKKQQPPGALVIEELDNEPGKE